MGNAFADNAGYRRNIRPGFVGDVLSREHLLPGGAKIDAAAFNSADAIRAVVGVAGAAIGATSVPVAALPAPIPANTLLSFGALAPVAVTVGVAGAAQGATSVPVAALSGPIPGGTILDFGGAKLAVLTADAAAGATALAVRALPTALVSGDAATFKGGTKQARLTAEAVKGATALAVDELQFALASGDTAYYNLPGKTKRIAAGTIVGLTNAELEAAAAGGVKWGPADDNDDVVRITAFDVPDADTNNDVELLRAGTLIKVNFLPGWAGASAAVKAKIRAAYEVTVGAPGDEVPAT
jgi:hypothetical protein